MSVATGVTAPPPSGSMSSSGNWRMPGVHPAISARWLAFHPDGVQPARRCPIQLVDRHQGQQFPGDGQFAGQLRHHLF